MPAPSTCDLLIADGVVFAGDGAILADGAVAVAGRRIVAVGPTADLATAFAPRRRISAKGGIVMPGLVNTHNHTPLMITRGMVEDRGFAPAYTKGIPQGHWLDDEDTFALSRLGAYELLRQGSTTIVDYYRRPEACARAATETGLRAFIGGRIHDADTSALAEGAWTHDPRIGAASLKENADLIDRWHGAADGRIRAIVAPHAPDTCSRALLVEAGDLARARNLPVHTHLCQSPMELLRVRAREGIGPVELLDEAGLLGPSLVAAHCIFVDEADIGRLGRAAVVVAHSPVGNASSGTIAPIAALADSGATITLCTDTMTGDMFEAMRTALAVARIKGAGLRFKAADAFAWATVNGARALGLGGEVGTLRQGALADIVLLDPTAPNLRPIVDGVGIVVHSGSGRAFSTVVIDGRVVLEDGRPTLFDGEAVIAAAQRAAERLWRRAGYAPVTNPSSA